MTASGPSALTEQDFPFGYCTNVHAGADLSQAKENLDRYATAVRQHVARQGRLPIGLWLSQSSAESLASGGLDPFGQWLADRRLFPYTLNGFPQGDFHQPVVKHRVYEPTWCCESRASHTMRLAEILDHLLPKAAPGSISTLPLGWPYAPWHAENFKQAADHLLSVARFLDRLSQQRGAEIVLAIEPEPGCVLDTAEDIVAFFSKYLFSGPDAQLARRYLTVCHDICHSGVMFEPQSQTLQSYLENGIRVGKVQVSSAVHVPWDTCRDQPESQQAMLDQLAQFNEPKYLHQTSVATQPGLAGHATLARLHEDLPAALASCQSSDGAFPATAWRVHFHVPIFVDQFGQLSTTQADIREACEFLETNKRTTIDGRDWFSGHYEVETYAWPVLPPELRANDLSEGIAEELRYFRQLLTGLATPPVG